MVDAFLAASRDALAVAFAAATLACAVLDDARLEPAASGVFDLVFRLRVRDGEAEALPAAVLAELFLAAVAFVFVVALDDAVFAADDLLTLVLAVAPLVVATLLPLCLGASAFDAVDFEAVLPDRGVVRDFACDVLALGATVRVVRRLAVARFVGGAVSPVSAIALASFHPYGGEPSPFQVFYDHLQPDHFGQVEVVCPFTVKSSFTMRRQPVG